MEASGSIDSKCGSGYLSGRDSSRLRSRRMPAKSEKKVSPSCTKGGLRVRSGNSSPSRSFSKAASIFHLIGIASAWSVPSCRRMMLSSENQLTATECASPERPGCSNAAAQASHIYRSQRPGPNSCEHDLAASRRSLSQRASYGKKNGSAGCHRLISLHAHLPFFGPL